MGLYEAWMSKEVKVKSGSFKGWCGRVSRTINEKEGLVEVSFPVMAQVERLIFHVSQIETLRKES